MSRLSDSAKLLAIGLLNYADDEGFFQADARLVRAALRPLDEDSSIVTAALDELTRAEWIKVENHANFGPIGCVLTFRMHQRISKPYPSRLAPYVPQLVKECSRKGKQPFRTGNRIGIGNRKGVETTPGTVAECPADAGPTSAKQTTEEWLADLKANPAYTQIDVDREHAKMCCWCAANRKQPTQRRFVNWLNRVDVPAGNGTATSYRKPYTPNI